MKKILSTLLVGLAMSSTIAFAAPASTSNDTLRTSSTPAKTEIPLSFVQTATEATLSQDPKESNIYVLTLYGVSPYITYVTNRPNRATGLALVNNFMKAWSVGRYSFKRINPNAVITAAKINKNLNTGNQVYIIQLSHPEYDIRRSKMRYYVRNLGPRKFILKELKMQGVTLVIN
jgi:hypothetical protein